MPDIGSGYTAASVTTLNFNGWWLVNPNDSTYNVELSVIGNSFKRTKKEEQSIYEPLGRSLPIVVRGVMRGEKFTLTIEFLTEADWQKFENLRNQQVTLLLKRGYTGEQWYGVLGAERELSEAPSDHTYKVISVPFIETDAP